MKKIFLSILTIAALASCKKDYTCSCTNSRTYTAISNPTNLDIAEMNSDNTYTSKTEFEKVSKKMVLDKTECYSTERSNQESVWYDFDPLTGESKYEMVNVTDKSDCTISK